MQLRYHNYQRPLVSLDENHRVVGLMFPGIYCGWDAMASVGGNALRLSHLLTGIQRTELNGSQSNKMGLVVSRQGVFVYEDAAIDVNVDFNTGNSEYRIDILIMTHSFIDTPGGTAATYSVVKGALGGPVEPALPNPANQVKIGRFIVAPNAADHTATKYERASIGTLGGMFPFHKINETDVFAVDSTNLFANDFNKLDKSGFYFINTTNNRPTTGSSEWFVLVLRKDANSIVQLAQANNSAKVYSRAYFSAAWTSWVNLNNVDLETDISSLQTAIGTRLYSENNYVIDLEPITLSIDALDVYLKDISDRMDQAEIDINNLETAIGTRVYDKNAVIDDAESITSSLNKLDTSWSIINVSDNLNNFLKPGWYKVNGGATQPANAPPYKNFGSVYPTFLLQVTAINTISGVSLIHQLAFNLNGRSIWRRSYTVETTTWGAWGIDRHALEIKTYTGLNLDTNATLVLAPFKTGLPTNKFKGIVLGYIFDNSGESTKFHLPYITSALNIDGTLDIVADVLGECAPTINRRAGGTFDAASFNAATLVIHFVYDDSV